MLHEPPKQYWSNCSLVYLVKVCSLILVTDVLTTLVKSDSNRVDVYSPHTKPAI